MNEQGPDAPGNTLPDPAPEGQYRLIIPDDLPTHDFFLSWPDGEPITVPVGTVVTINVDDVGEPDPYTSIGTFGNTPNQTKIIILPDDNVFFDYLGNLSGNNGGGSHRKRKTRKTRKTRKQRKARKQKSNRKSRRARRRN
jgi:hypothetical protein